MPTRKEDIFQLNFPVPSVNKKNTFGDSLQLFYAVGNLKDENKQFQTILNIAQALSKEKEKYFFVIAGNGYNQDEFKAIWPQSMVNNVKYLGLVTNDEIIHLLPKQDVFLLPSLSEGLPVSLVEAMKAGVVPLVTNWKGATSELVIENQTGFYFEIGATHDYVHTIVTLNKNRHLLQRISENANEKANLLFDPMQCVKKFEHLFGEIFRKKTMVKIAFKAYGSRLDNMLFPNIVTKFFRSFGIAINLIFLSI